MNRESTPDPARSAARKPPGRPHARAVAGARRVRLGESVQGRPIELHIFGRSGPALFIMAGIHGSEPTSVDVALGLLEELRRNKGLYADCTIGILPRANPDGLVRRRRSNMNRVDLNRNFAARNWKKTKASRYGTAPLSEPETRAIVRAINLLDPVCAVSIHSIARGRHCNNFDGPARRYAELLGRYNGYPVTDTMGYPTPGSFGSWLGHDRQIPTITLELPREHTAERAWDENREALLALIRSIGGGRAEF